MKKLLLLALLALALIVATASIASAQAGGRSLHALTLEDVGLYAEPNSSAEVTADLSAGTTVTVVSTDQSGAWLEVETADGTGYVPLDSALVLNLPALARKAYVATSSAGATSLFANPRLGVDYLTSLPDHTVGTVLGAMDEWAYVMTPLSTGWSIASDWETMPEGSRLAQVSLGATDELGVFTEPNISADLAGTVANGDVVWLLGAPEGEWVEVLLPESGTGYALLSNLELLPNLLVDAQAGRQSVPALYAGPDFDADIVGEVADGMPVVLLDQPDNFWDELYVPGLGVGYGLQSNFSEPYSVATVVAPEAVVRVGPDDTVYNAVAQLPAGTRVVVKGVNETGDWIRVAIPWDQVDYGHYGVEGWMRDYLFADANGNTDLNTEILPVVAP